MSGPVSERKNGLVHGGRNQYRAWAATGALAAWENAEINQNKQWGPINTLMNMRVLNDAKARGIIPCAWIMEGALDMADAFEASIEKAENGQLKLLETLKAFRGTIKNDLSSVAAAGDRLREEARKIHLAVETLIGLMNGSEMLRAIEHTERLARAMKDIADLQQTRVAFALISQEAGVTPYENLSMEERARWRSAIKDTFTTP